MAHSRLRPTFTFNEERLAALKGIAPEAFADGKINWDVLREALGEHLEDDDAQAEHFGLNWPGKRAARRLAGTPSKGTLVPQPGKGVNEDTTRNVFIEGENLEVLKLLQQELRIGRSCCSRTIGCGMSWLASTPRVKENGLAMNRWSWRLHPALPHGPI